MGQIGRRRQKAVKSLPEFNKYDYYLASVQSPETDVKFFRKAYKDAYGEVPENFTLREDFCGTFAVCKEFVKLKEDFHAIGVDLDPEPLEYGRTNFLGELNDEQRRRLTILEDDVLNPKLPKAHMIAATNFSYYIFKERQQLKDYFAAARKALGDDGLFLMDCFGGSQCYEANEEETEYEDEGFSYFWDQDSFDPISNEAMFYIHFKRKGEKRREKVFTYDWRMWSIPELKDILHEVGFKSVQVYWEGTSKDGEGNGVFKPATEGEDCESWVAYIAAKPE